MTVLLTASQRRCKMMRVRHKKLQQLFGLLRKYPGPRYWHVWIGIGLLRAIAWLPLPLLHFVGLSLGELAWHLHAPRREITLINLRACFPQKTDMQLHSLGRAHFRTLMSAIVISSVAWWGSAARMERLTRFKNQEILQQTTARGENIIFLAPHFTGLEYTGIYLSLLAPMACMYRNHQNPLMDTIVYRRRGRFGLVQYSRRAAPKSMIRQLRQRRWFYYLPDQDPGTMVKTQGVFAPFYNIPTATFASLGRIASLGNAVVVPCVSRILPWGRGIEICFAPPLKNYPSGDALKDATLMNRAIEKMIAHAPEQYLWSHRRFKTRPTGEKPFYP